MHTRTKIAAVGASSLAILILIVVAVRAPTVPFPATAPPWVSSQAEDSAPGYDNPDRFFAYHAAIRGAGEGPGYPPNYRLEAFNKAVAARKRPARRLAWVERGPANAPGRTRALIVDPDDPSHQTWYAGSVSGGLWKTVDAGASWEVLTDHLPNLAVSALAMASSDTDVIYMGTGEGFGNVDAVGGSGIFRSTDRGRSWVQLPSTVRGSAFRFVNRMVVDPDDEQTVVAATNEGLFRTSDGGETWGRVYSRDAGYPSRIQDLRAKPDDFNVQFAAVNDYAILRSIDAGRTWEVSLDEIGTPVGRLELAISPTSPATVYVAGGGDASGQLHRSKDAGLTWSRVLFDSRHWSTDHLGEQNWYNMTLAVHPYDVDQVLAGGVSLTKAFVGSTMVDRKWINNVSSLYPWTEHIRLTYFGGNYRGWLQTGDEVSEVLDVTPDDFFSFELRFGPGRSQKAHRFTVSRASTGTAENKLDLPFSEYEYQDYVEVPFEMWDIDNNRQLMVSFRDQANDGQFNLVPERARGPRDSLSREVVAVHGYAYDANEADERLARDGGLVNKLVYYFVPALQSGAVWDPGNLPAVWLRINVARAAGLSGEVRLHAANCCVHVDHHNLICIPVNEATGEFKVLNANDGGVYFSEDGGETFTGSTGYNTTQFYGLDKKPGENVYIGGTQDNGTWVSGADPQRDAGWDHVTGGDGFDAIWHAKNTELVLASAQSNRFYRSYNGGKKLETGRAS